jgi:hypothetical protein
MTSGSEKFINGASLATSLKGVPQYVDISEVNFDLKFNDVPELRNWETRTASLDGTAGVMSALTSSTTVVAFNLAISVCKTK